MGDRLPELRTERLLLRPWRVEDREAFAVMNADPEVMEFLPLALSRAESDALADRIEKHFAQHGFSLWALEVAGGPSFIGFAGLLAVGFEAPFTPAVEVGWRLAREHWGMGYATEAARAAIRYGFERGGLDEIVAFTFEGNLRSRRVMERIDMTRDPADDFEHPLLPSGHPLRRHVLFRLLKTRATTTSVDDLIRAAADDGFGD